MPSEDWIQHWKVAQFLYDWQTLIAGVLAVLAAWRTIRATTKSANREIDASKAQTAVAQKEIETTVRLEQDRVASEARAFRVMLEAAMTRVLGEAAWAKKAYPETFKQTTDIMSVNALAVRQCITKGAFAELRDACVRQGSPLTGEFLDLEAQIDNFASQWELDISLNHPIRKGKHAGLGDQLALIEAKATELRDKAARDRWGLVLPGRAERAGI